MDVRDLDVADYLSKEEKTTLDDVTKQSNKARLDKKESRDFLNIPLTKLFENWAETMNSIIKELTSLFGNIRKFSRYFNDIDNFTNWWIGMKNFLSEFIYIFVKKERSIYFGVTMVIFALLIFVIQITS